MSWCSKIASISARSASAIDQPMAPTLSSTSATVRQPTSAVLTAGCEIAPRRATCGRLLSSPDAPGKRLRAEPRVEEPDRAHLPLPGAPVRGAEVHVLGEGAREQAEGER